MSKRQKNVTPPERNTTQEPRSAQSSREAGLNEPANTALRSFREKEFSSNVTPIRTASVEARRPSTPPHMEHIIRRRAYELYEKRGCQDGHAEEDWLRAESEVLGTVLGKGSVGYSTH